MKAPKKVSATMMAAHLGLSRPYLDRLVTDGTIAKDEAGKFSLDETRLRYIRKLREMRRSSPAVEAHAQYQQAKARRLELENARLESRLMEVDDHIASVDEIVGIMLTGLSSLPARCTRDLRMRRAIEAGIIQIRQEIAQKAAEKTREHENRVRSSGS
jgi:phage terminase Nu1 subunit (DNA packaging protein)